MPYTYIITHIPSNVKYYGVQYNKNANPEDLGTKYFSSSNVLKLLIKEEGIINFSFEVRKTFSDKHEALRWENRFLTRINAAKSELWFNLRNGSGCNSGGYTLSKVTKEKMSKPKSEDHKLKLKNHLDEVRTIPKWDEERKHAMSKSLMGNTINNGRKHGKYLDERKHAISKSLMGNTNGSGPHTMKIVACPHCGKTGSGGNMSRYHFDKCSIK